MEVQTEQTTDVQVTSQENAPSTQEAGEQQTSEVTTESPGDNLGWTEEQKAYIKGLRDENAKYRTRAKERDSEVQQLSGRLSQFESGLKKLFGEDSEENMTPEQQIESLTAHAEQLEMNNAITEVAMEYGVGKDDMGYFRYKINEALSELEEGAELTEEQLDEIVTDVRARSPKPANTSVEGTANQSATPQTAQGSDEISVEQFAKMGLGEKSSLFQKNQDLYNRLSAAAKEKGILI